MLSPATPFPHPGSYGLHEDPALAPGDRRAELVRILERGNAVALVAYPLREGAGGNQRVPLADIVDATPLTHEESREMTDLARSLVGRSMRTKAQRAAKARHDVLQSRNIWSGSLQRQLDTMNARQRAQRQDLAA